MNWVQHLIKFMLTFKLNNELTKNCRQKLIAPNELTVIKILYLKKEAV